VSVPRRVTRSVQPGTYEVFAADEQLVPIPLPELVDLARESLAALGVAPDAVTNLLLVDPDSMQSLNEQFRGKDEPTDVLSFPMDDEALPGAERPARTRPGGSEDVPLILGDLVICPEIAQMQADLGGWKFADELALLTVHGILHLCGYDHEEESDALVMEAKEAELLDTFWSGANARRTRDAADFDVHAHAATSRSGRTSSSPGVRPSPGDEQEGGHHGE